MATASTSFLPASDAIAHLKTYTRGDGLSLRELMDSRVNGGLTYNDILVSGASLCAVTASEY